MPQTDRFSAAIARFDAVNAEDPVKEQLDGETCAKELLYARRMSDCLEQYAPDASEALQLAARCQHIRRWAIPRGDYPMDRAGYQRWRTRLGQFHADTAGEILAQVGYDVETIERVKTLLQKKQLKRDPEVQTLEDVICLVFLEHYIDEFASRHSDEKLIGILRKVWNKMSDKGHAAALEVPLSPNVSTLLHKALEK